MRLPGGKAIVSKLRVQRRFAISSKPRTRDGLVDQNVANHAPRDVPLIDVADFLGQLGPTTKNNVKNQPPRLQAPVCASPGILESHFVLVLCMYILKRLSSQQVSALCWTPIHKGQ